MTWVLHTINAKKRRRTVRAVRKGVGVVNGEVLVEEGDWENTTSPETERTETARLRFPNPAKFEGDFSAIYQCDKGGFRGRYNQGMSSDQPRYPPEKSSDQPRYPPEKSSDQPRVIQTRNSEQPKRRNPRYSWRSSSVDQSTISCYNELNRSFKSNCDLHLSPGSRTSPDKFSPNHVHESSHRIIQPPHSLNVNTGQVQQIICACGTDNRSSSPVKPTLCGNGVFIANKNSYSTDV